MVMTRPLDMFDQYVAVSGTWQWDDQARVINVRGDVRIRFSFQDSSGVWIPYEFGEVSGDFDCHAQRLTSLYNAPRKVGGNFYANYLPLQSLEDGPVYVGGDYYVDNCSKLTSLKGLAPEIGGELRVEWRPIMPLLSTLVAQGGVNLQRPTPSATWADIHNTDKVKEILNKYAGGGRKVALSCAAELNKAGFRENARW